MHEAQEPGGRVERRTAQARHDEACVEDPLEGLDDDDRREAATPDPAEQPAPAGSLELAAGERAREEAGGGDGVLDREVDAHAADG